VFHLPKKFLTLNSSQINRILQTNKIYNKIYMNSFQAFITINKEMNANLYKTIIKLACYIIKACHSYFSGHFLMFSKKLNGLIQVLGRISHVPMNLMTSKSISSYASHLTTHHS